MACRHKVGLHAYTVSKKDSNTLAATIIRGRPIHKIPTPLDSPVQLQLSDNFFFKSLHILNASLHYLVKCQVSEIDNRKAGIVPVPTFFTVCTFRPGRIQIWNDGSLGNLGAEVSQWSPWQRPGTGFVDVDPQNTINACRL